MAASPVSALSLARAGAGLRSWFVFSGLVAAILASPPLTRGDDPAPQNKPASAPKTEQTKAEKANDAGDSPQADEAFTRKGAKPRRKPSKEDGEAKPEAKEEDPPKGDAEKKDEKGADGEKKEGPANPPAQNPLVPLIQKIFGRGNAPPIPAQPGAQPDVAKPANGDTTARDNIDARAPHDPQQLRRLKAVQRAIQEKNWRSAVDGLQIVLDQPQDTLFRQQSGRWISVRGEANRLLGTLPKEAIDLYELQFGPTARRLLAEAHSQGNRDSLAEAATRYFYTRAGQQAADRLAAQNFSHGEFALAAGWYRELQAARSPLTESPAWKLRAAMAFHRAGDGEASQALLSKLKTGGIGAEIEIAGLRMPIEAWWKKAALERDDRPGSLDEWPVFLGTSTRAGVASGGDPLLLPRWSVPLTSSTPVRDQIESLLDDLADAKRAMVPALFPLMMDDKAIFRTLRGFAVVDVSTGKVQWETREGVSAERLLNGIAPGDNEAVQFRFGRQFFVQQYIGNGQGDQHPLTHLLFRDSNYGIAASDARRLYVVEDLAILSRFEQNYGWWNGMQQNDAYSRDWASNKLTAYDLQSGRPLWDTGGEEMNEPFDLPLSGTFFFGAPLPEGEELFAVGEKSNEIRLHCIDALTGRPVWSQLLAVSDAKIEQDFARRRWGAPIASRDGILVCPTTVGWLVAVDRTRRGILWAHRYAKPRPEFQQFNNIPVMPTGELNSQWTASAPIIVGNRVVFAPPEEPVLLCLNLNNGGVEWEHPKDDGVYVAGVFGKHVLVAGKQAVTAYDIEDGNEAWKTTFTDDAHPSGFGVAVGDVYHIPLSSGQLWTISLADGKVAAKSYLPAGAPSLGNLGMYRGLLLSVSTEGLTAFEQRAAIEAEIARRKQKNPNDSWALLREADIALLKRDYPFAVERLRKVSIGALPEADRPRFRREMVDTLAAIIQSDFKGHDAEAAELAAFVETDPEKLVQQRMAAERLQVRKDSEAAFRAYLDLIDRPLAQMVAQGSTPVKVRLDLWLAGRLADLWKDATPEVRNKLTPVVAERAAKALAGKPDDRRLFVRLFEFHEESVAVRRKLVEDLAAAGNTLAAEAELLQLQRHSDPKVAAGATERLGKLLGALGHPHDAAYHYLEMEKRWPDAVLADGSTAKETVERLRRADLLETGARPTSWGEFDLQLQRSVPNYSQQDDQDLSDGLSRLPYFREHRIRMYPNTQHLAVLNAETDQQDWIVGLRMSARNSQSQWAAAQTSGHALYVLHRDVLHCLSPLERKVLWTRSIDNRGASSGYYRHPVRPAPQPMRPSPVNLWSDESNQDGMLAVANERYVCVYGRREFSVLDRSTGEVLWSRGDVPAGTTVFGTSDALVVNLSDGPILLRALDGKELDAGPVRKVLAQLVTVAADRFVILETEGNRRLFGLKGPGSLLRAIDPLTGGEIWKAEMPSGTQFTSLGPEQLIALKSDGRIEVLDLVTGKQQALGQVDAADLKNRAETYAFQDDQRIYVLVNHPRRPQQFSFGEEISTLPANGVLAAFDRATGAPLWKEKVQNHTLVVPHLSQSPVLTFSTRNYVRKGNFSYWHLKLLVLDKQTGRKLLESTTPTNSGFRSLDVNMADRFVELKSYNERLRFVAVPRASKEQVSAPEKKEPEKKE